MAFMPILRFDREDLKPLQMLKGNVRFAAAKALTRTAKDAQTALQAETPHIFHLRNSWVPKGIRIDAATPSTLNAKVGSVDKYMARHVLGETKKASHSLSIRRQRDGRGRLATGGLLIPTYNNISDVKTHTQTRRQLARIDRQKRKTFQIFGRGQGKILLVRRTSKKRHPLQVLAILHNDAHQIKIWKMDQTVDRSVSAHFMSHLEASISI